MVDGELYDMSRRIKRGLSGYVSYLAACEMNEAFSEYVLYEPILRILLARGFRAESEVECPNIEQPSTGDKKRLDFVVSSEKDLHFAIEVKWALTDEGNDELTKKPVDVSSDLPKMIAFATANVGNRSFLCVFGRASAVEGQVNFKGDSNLLSRLKDFGDLVIADMAQTRFGCRFFELV